jgi:hypothetical protein
VLHVDAGHHLEQLAGHVHRGSDAARRKVDLARIGLGVGNELGHARHWDRRVHLHHIGHADDASDWRAVAHDVETELVIDGSVNRVVWTDHEECVAVGRRPDRSLGGDVAGGAGPILDDDLLAKLLRQPLTQQAADHVLRAAGGKADEQTHRPDRISLRPCNARHSRKRGSARGQMQKSSAAE